MEEYFEKGDVEVATLKRCIKAGTISGAFRPVLCGTAFKNKGVQPLLDAVVDYLPSPIDVPGISVAAGRGRGGRRALRPPPHQGRPERAVRRPRVQDHQRQVRHADLRARLCRHAEVRRHGDEHHQGPSRAHRADVPDARRQARRDQGGARRRHRRLRRAEGHRHRRHAGLAAGPGGAGAHGLPGAGDRHLGRAAHQGGGREDVARPAEAGRPRTPRCGCAPTRRPARPSCRAWASCIWRSSSTGCAANTASRRISARRRWRIARRSPGRTPRPTRTRSRPAVPASTPR